MDGDFDQQTKMQVLQLRNSDPAGLEDAFYKNLEFGTGGLRGIMGVGTNRMNKYTVGMATQGLANYILSHCKGIIQVCAYHLIPGIIARSLQRLPLTFFLPTESTCIYLTISDLRRR